MTTPSRRDRIEAALSGLFPPNVAVAALPLTDADPDALWPSERSAIDGAVPQRRTEFAAGRQVARAALARCGQPPFALPMGPDRAPIWPRGLFGSISHAAGWAVAAVTNSGPIGVDIEEDEPLPGDAWPIVATPQESDTLPAASRGRQLRRLFAAKEALFKAQMPENRVMFGFDAVEVTLANDTFDATFRTSVGAFRPGDRIRGRLAVAEGLILAGVIRCGA